MSQDNKKYKRIRADEAAGLLGWDLPHMNGPASSGLACKEPSDRVQVVEEEIAAEKITVSELESIRESARLEGLAAGLEEGRALGLAEGKEQGLAEGKKQGLQQGLQKGEAEIQRAKKLLANAVGELTDPLNSSTDQLEAVLLNLVVNLSETVVLHELSCRKDLLRDAIKNALRQMPEPLSSVELRVNSADQEYVSLSSLLPDSALSIIPDDSITSGGFKLRTEATMVEDEVEQRFSQVASQLLEGLSVSSAEKPDEQDS